MNKRPNCRAQRRSPLLIALLSFSFTFGGCSDDPATEGTSDSGAVDTSTNVDDGVVGGCKSAADCDDPKDPCLRAACGAAGKCTTEPADGRPCDDNDPCTAVDLCKQGKCLGLADQCACRSTADCDPLEDGNSCNGTLFCDKAKAPYRCAIKPGSVVACGDKTSPCRVYTCLPKTGKCAEIPGPDGAACDDGKPCTQLDLCKGGACVGLADECECETSKDCESLEDGSLCNGTLFCKKDTIPYRCATNPKSLVKCATNKDTACRKSACVPSTGVCKPHPVEHLTLSCDASLVNCKWEVAPPGGATPTVVCDDGNKCTVSETCLAGACEGGIDVCSCKTNADCGIHEDGDFCNGALFCDKTPAVPACKVNPATLIQCNASADKGCLVNACVPVSGACAMTPRELTKACDKTSKCAFRVAPKAATDVPCFDGDPCTVGDICKGGQCTSGNNNCACTSDASCAKFEDGNACNGKLFCDKATGKCRVSIATATICKAGQDTACTKNACDPKTGNCKPAPAEVTVRACYKGAKGSELCSYELPVGATRTVACDDGDKCSVGDTCAKGQCEAGKSGPCTCQVDADCGAFEDGNACNGTLFCDKSVGNCRLNKKTRVVCKTTADTQCLRNACVPATGECIATPAELTKKACWSKDAKGKPVDCTFALAPAAEATNTVVKCEDNTPCTHGDRCAKGHCKPGINTCECDAHPDCAKKEDGNACNGTLYCDKTGKQPACKVNPATVIKCAPPQGEPCKLSVCDPTSGKCAKQPTKDGKSCDDGSACTTSDRCQSGGCMGDVIKCDDANPCTVESCDKSLGCVAKPRACSDGNACTLDLCDKKTGYCSFEAAAKDGGLCNADNSGCTVNDSCNNGTCLAGTLATCKGSSSACVQPVCKSKGLASFECISAARPDGAPCPDAQPCLVGSSCQSGKCVAGKYPRVFVRSIAAAGESVALQAVAEASTATIITAGAWWKGDEAKPTVRGWKFAAVNALGGPVWAHSMASKSTDPRVGANAATLVDGPRFVAIGADTGAKTGLDVRIVHLGATGDVLLDKRFEAAGDDNALGVAHHPDGAVTMAGWVETASERDGLAMRVAKSGAVLWKTRIERKGGGDELRGVALLAKGPLLAGQSSTFTKGQTHGWLVHLDADGKVVWQRNHGSSTAQGFNAAATLADNTVALAGWRQGKSGTNYWLARARDNGSLAWSRSSAGVFVPNAVVVTGAGAKQRWWVTGRAGDKAGADVLVMGVDGLGNRHWLTSLDEGGVESGAGIAAASDATALIAGRQAKKAGKSGFVARLSAWGHKTCGEGAGCLGKKPGDCDDGKVCTRDFCDAGQCKNAEAADMTCDPQDGCTVVASCVKGGCQKDPNGRLFARTYALTGQTQHFPAIGAVRVNNGNIVLLIDDGAKTTYRLALISADGQLLADKSFAQRKVVGYWHNKPTIKTYSRIERRLLPLGQGGVAVVTVQHGGWADVAATYFHNADLSAVAAAADTTKSVEWKRAGFDVAAYPDGAVATAGGGGYQLYPKSGTTWHGWSIATGRQFTTDKSDFIGNMTTRYKPHAVDGRAVPLADGGVAGLYTINGRMNDYAEEPSKKDSKPPYEALWVRLDKAGGLVWERLEQLGKSTEVLGGASGQYGVVGAGRFIDNTGQGRWYVTLRSHLGAVRWRRLGTASEAGVVHAVKPLDDNRTMIAGQRAAGATPRGFLARLSPSGEIEWQRNYVSGVGASGVGASGLGATLLNSVVPLVDGGFVAVGWQTVGSLRRPLVVRTNSSGHASCAGTGGCEKPALNNCDDKDASTLDVCAQGKDGKAACVHTKLNCDDGNPCTIDTPSKAGCSHKPVVCKAKNACLVATCQPFKGCVNKAKNCVGEDRCFTAACHPQTGCLNKPQPAKKGCHLGPCGGGLCSANKCKLFSGRLDYGCRFKKPGKSCKDILDTHKNIGAPTSGLFWIDPDGSGPAKTSRVYCDMAKTSQGGGWMLLLNYKHPAGDARGVNPYRIPLSASDHSHGYLVDLGMKKDQITQVKFFCYTDIDRRLHWWTGHPSIIQAAYDGTKPTGQDYRKSVTMAPNHRFRAYGGNLGSSIPLKSGTFGGGLLGFTSDGPWFTFTVAHTFKPNVGWFIDVARPHDKGPRFVCGADSDKLGTLHQVWVR